MMRTTGAAWPGEFVEPIRDWVLEHRVSGRSVPTACARCGRRMYAFAKDVDVPSTCRDCRYGPPWTRVWKRIAHIVYIQLWIVGLVALFVLMAVIVPEGS